MNSIQDRNGNNVSMEDPLLTVLTHGLGGSDYHWSNIGNEQLGYTSDSIITRIFNSGPCNVYVARYRKDRYELYDITSQIEAAIQEDMANGDSSYTVKFNCDSTNAIESIKDISKHSIIIFDGESADSENYKIYREFNYVVSRVVYDIKLLNNNKLPRMNLIGHSRGGLTNIEYALDHPDMVASIFSLGTPYCGSSTASIDYALGCPIGRSPEGEFDIITESKYMNYLNRWNNNYETLGYDKIDVHALGGYGTLLFYQTMVWTEQGQKGLNDLLNNKFPAEIVAAAVDALFLGIEYAVLKSYTNFISSSIAAKKRIIGTIVSETLANLDLSSTAIDDIIQILISELNLDYHFPFVSWYNDGLVDLNSQLGLYGGAIISTKSYKGFNR